jgi:pimeloyl-ACP methyl ester carboxylesterase
MKAALLITLTFSALVSSAKPADFSGFVEVEKDRLIYVDWRKAAPGKKTVILLNGLTYNVNHWQALASSLSEKGYGVFRYDPAGMGQTLELSGKVMNPISIEAQARDLHLLTSKLGLKGRLNLLGLSYGGGLLIAFAKDYANRIGQAILFAPFTEPLASQDQMIRDQILWTRKNFPLNPATDEELYAYYLRQNVYYVYPRSEPSMLESPLKPEAVFQLIQGIRKYDMKTASQQLPAKSVHFVIAGQDQYIPRESLLQFWRQLPGDSCASLMLMLFTEHKMTEAQPAFSATWVDLILSGDASLQKGKSFIGNPLTGEITPQ